MEGLGINGPLLLTQIINFLFLINLLALPLLAILKIRGRSLPPTAMAVWVLVIVGAPIVGPLSFLVLNPGEPRERSAER